MEKKFVVDYDNKVLTLHYLEQVFMFDLNTGDTGDFWHGFTLKNGTELDVNFHQESAKDEPYCEIWSVSEGYGNYPDDMFLSYQQINVISDCEILGNPTNYFGAEPVDVPWMNAFQLDKQFTNFKIR